jgi:hypothetical protein
MNDDKLKDTQYYFNLKKKKTCIFTRLYLIYGKSLTPNNVKIAINILHVVCYMYIRINTINISLIYQCLFTNKDDKLKEYTLLLHPTIRCYRFT